MARLRSAVDLFIAFLAAVGLVEGLMLAIAGSCLTLFVLYLVLTQSRGLFSLAADVFPALGVMAQGLFILAVVAPFLVRGAEKRILARERKAAAQALRQYAPRWLGIYSPADEVILALRTSLSLRGSGRILPRRRRTQAVFYGETWRKYGRLGTLPLDLVVNHILAPLGDRFIWSRLAEFFQGNDRPGSVVVNVGPAPLPTLHDCPPIPRSVSDPLMDMANHELSASIPQSRNLLGAWAAEARGRLTFDAAAFQLSGKALVHSCYFESPDILRILLLHIRQTHGATETTELPETAVEDRHLSKWVGDFKAYVAGRLAESLQSVA